MRSCQLLKCQISPRTGFPAKAKCRVLFLPYISFSPQGYNSVSRRCMVRGENIGDISYARPRVGGENGVPSPIAVTGSPPIRCERVVGLYFIT